MKTERWVQLHAEGVPVPQGSKSIGAHGQMYDRAGQQLKQWRETVGWQASAAMRKEKLQLFTGPVRAVLVFQFTRPDSHYGKAGALKETAPPYPLRPDLDKLIRAVLDALTGIVYIDDKQVVSVEADRIWGRSPGVTVVVAEI